MEFRGNSGNSRGHLRFYKHVQSMFYKSNPIQSNPILLLQYGAGKVRKVLIRLYQPRSLRFFPSGLTSKVLLLAVMDRTTELSDEKTQNVPKRRKRPPSDSRREHETHTSFPDSSSREQGRGESSWTPSLWGTSVISISKRFGMFWPKDKN